MRLMRCCSYVNSHYSETKARAGEEPALFKCLPPGDHKSLFWMYSCFRTKENRQERQVDIMYGAILGDIIGSRFEFDRGGKTKDFELLTIEDKYTDDSVMTVAVAEGLLNAGKDASVEEIENRCIESMKKWGKFYPNAGYGQRFWLWLFSKKKSEPYGSYGNGSAMRVSAAGWLYDSIERTREVARATANVTHNHPEGIKGAECTAAVIFLARTGISKEEIEEYVIREFGYDFSESLDEMRARHKHVESCQDSLPKALRSFFDGDSYEDVVRNAVSLGGDTDTLAAIAGSMAEAFYDMPVMLRAETLGRIEDDMRDVVMRFDTAIGRGSSEHEDEYEANKFLMAAYYDFRNEPDEERRSHHFVSFLNAMAQGIFKELVVPMPFVDVNNTFDAAFNLENAKIGETLQLQEEVRLRMDTMKDPDGNLWLPLFFNTEAMHKGETANIIMPVTILDVLKFGLEGEDLKGVVIDPFDRPFTLSKDLLEKFLSDYEGWAVQKNGNNQES